MNRFWWDIKEKTRGMDSRRKAEYIAVYYWHYMLGICAVLGLVLFLIVHFAFPGEDTVFSCALVNQKIDRERDRKLAESFAKAAGIEADNILFDSDYNISYPGHEWKDVNESSFEKLLLKWSNGQIDAIVMPEDFVDYCVGIGGEFYSISDFGTEQLQLYQAVATGVLVKGTNLEPYMETAGAEGALVLLFPKEGKHREICQKFIDFIKSAEK